ncbi:CBL-interacting serine/threonine-protein kinase 16 [Rosa chinensis]|uniref:CBL-interacting serine/threonine-protein kinase 16 n=1 Tax=Rosa chinensis TaxID=74649 RepID=UPI000D089F12|nr:CBL-interacting serine/threonine-protein kinase 16 [Rosa chinensis]
MELVLNKTLGTCSTENLDPSLRKKKRDFYLRERERDWRSCQIGNRNLLCEGGELLDKILSRGGRYTEEDAKVIVVQILSVIAYCHLQGVVHRDLKPEVMLAFFSVGMNLLSGLGAKIERESKLKLNDFDKACHLVVE